MSFFTVEEIEVPVFENYEDGEYKMEILDVEKKSSWSDGVYIEIQRQFMDSKYEGKIWVKKYKISSENNMVRNIAKQEISRMAVDVANLKPGEELEPEHLIGKITKIIVKNEPSKNGIIFSNIKKEILVEPKSNEPIGIAGSGMQPFQAPSLPSDTLNDQVSF